MRSSKTYIVYIRIQFSKGLNDITKDNDDVLHFFGRLSPRESCVKPLRERSNVVESVYSLLPLFSFCSLNAYELYRGFIYYFFFINSFFLYIYILFYYSFCPICFFFSFLCGSFSLTLKRRTLRQTNGMEIRNTIYDSFTVNTLVCATLHFKFLLRLCYY